MKRFFTFLVGLIACVTVAYAFCPICDEWVDPDMWCSTHELCVECAMEEGSHCPECGICLAELDQDDFCDTCHGCKECTECCPDCSQCTNCMDGDTYCNECFKCNECFDDFCLHCLRCSDCMGDICGECGYCDECAIEARFHCAECLEHIDGEGQFGICKECHTCADCNEICSECLRCGTCAGEEFCSDHGMCNECATREHFHCYNCGECDDLCETCNACSDCIESEYFHCLECGSCFVEVDFCEKCGGWAAHCEACSEEYTCIVCFTCYFVAQENFCDECQICLDCCMEYGFHCVICGEHSDVCEHCWMCDGCAVSEQVHCEECEECYAGTVEYCATHGADHCSTCAEPYTCSVCEECFYDDSDSFYESIMLCHECAIQEGEYCIGCENIAADVCPDCEYCIDCREEFNAHCVECNECYGESGVCDNCRLCDECALSSFVHCSGCGECFGSEGSVCEDCGFCEVCYIDKHAHCEECGECFGGEDMVCEYCGQCSDCALDNMIHCELCETCTYDVEVCDNCGLCEECAENEGIHCSLCGECRPDDRCPNDGDHCSDCCIDNGWLCKSCDVCMEAEGLSKCEECGLCIECCRTVSQDMKCSHGICVESSAWSSHYCTICEMCMSDCEHKKNYETHTCTFGPDGICSVCKASENGAPVIFRQPTNVTCDVSNYAGIKAKDGVSKYNTTSLEVLASGVNLTYQWYKETSTGASKLKNQTGSEELYYKGVTTNRLTLTAPSTCGESSTKYYCVVTNGNGSVTTNKVSLIALHSMAYEKYDSVEVAIHRASSSSTKDSLVTFAEFHTKHCVGKNCTVGSGTKQKHTGDWTVSVAPSLDQPGSRYRVCELCGEKQWQNMETLREDGYPQITMQPKSLKGLVAPVYEDVDDTYVTDTISFEVIANGKNLKYEWHELTHRVYSNNTYDKNLVTAENDYGFYINGADENRLTITVHPWSCIADFNISYYCIISNELGTISTDTVSIKSSCNWNYLTYNKLPADEDWSGLSIADLEKDNFPESGFNTKYSDYHFKYCQSTDDWWHYLKAGEQPRRISHKYGSWEKSAEHEGYAYKECVDCGEKYWAKCRTDNKPSILAESGDSKRKKVPDYRKLLDNDITQRYDTVSFWVDAMDANRYEWYITIPDEDFTARVSDLLDMEFYGYDDYNYYISGVWSNRLTITVPVMACQEEMYVYCKVSNGKGTTTSSQMLINAKHNVGWRSHSDMAKGLRTGKTVYSNYYGDPYYKYLGDAKPGLNYQPFSKVIFSCFEPGDSVKVYYDKYHYELCSSHTCPKWTGKKEMHTYGGWTVSVPPTSTTYGSRYRSCRVCGEKYWENINPVPTTKNPYTNEGAYFQITEVEYYGSDGFIFNGNMLSGVFRAVSIDEEDYDKAINSNEIITIVLPDGTTSMMQIGYIWKGTENLTSCVAGDKGVQLERCYPYLMKGETFDEQKFAEKLKAVADQSYAVSNPELFTFSTKTLATYSGPSAVKTDTTYVFDTDEGHVNVRFLDISGLDEKNAGEVMIEFDKDVLLYEGKKFKYTLSSGGGGKEKFERNVLTIGSIRDLDFYIVSTSNDTIRLGIDNKDDLLKGTVSYSYKDASISLRNANLKCIHLGESKINGKDFTINVMEGKNNISCRIGNAVDVLDKVIFHGEPGVSLFVKSEKGNAIQADCFESTDKKAWTLDCEGLNYGLKINQIRYSAGAEMHVKCASYKSNGYSAISPMKEAGFIDAAVYEDYVDYGHTDRYYDPSQGENVSGVYAVAGVDDVDIYDPMTELHFYVDPKIYLGDYEQSFNMGAKLHKGTFDTELIKRGTMSYDFQTHTLTLDNVSIDGSEYMEAFTLLFDKSNLDTLYVKLVGETEIFKDGGSAIFIDDANVKFIGDGELRAYGDYGFDCGRSAVLTAGEKVTLYADEVYRSSFSGYNNAKLVVGKNASIWADLGIEGFEDIIIENLGEKLTAEELAAVGNGFTENAIRPTRVFWDNIYCCEYDKVNRVLKTYDPGFPERNGIHVGENYGIRIGNQWLDEFSPEANRRLAQFDPSTNKLVVGYYAKAPDKLSAFLDNEAIYIARPGVTVEFLRNTTLEGSDMAPAITIAASNVTLVGDTTISVSVTADNADASGIQITENASLTVKDINLQLGDNANIISEAARTTGKNATNSSLRIKNALVEFGNDASIYGLNVTLATCMFEDAANLYGSSTDALSQVVNKKTSTSVTGNFNIVRFRYDLLPPPTPTEVEEVIFADQAEIDFTKPIYDVLGRRMMINRDYQGVVLQNGHRYLLNGK